MIMYYNTHRAESSNSATSNSETDSESSEEESDGSSTAHDSSGDDTPKLAAKSDGNDKKVSA